MGSADVDAKVLAAGRSACYKARDAFFQCVESSKGAATESGTVGLLYPADCKHSRAQFEKMCRSTWVRHFDRQHCAKKRAQRMLEPETRSGPINFPQAT
ncbi:hypothetical protein SELMODRAFT_187186 [Selaginella moellendorffii]|uniref:Cytochrome c oxidase assembly factor 6 n=1 Tax=Selaginella moellendorffii TaxID=88036 RepID=D8TBU6_SELML|nr:uncharacterized protein LOC9652238 [Selaginella moellendorffii]EFJ05883.1 hypothetical protein SELMODRAFT_187186 [Selaginella moellendorffii]|eukprot:XP_002993044.1 uncharacterized protein LOC9652238 [Selaginella moellendorffii]